MIAGGRPTHPYSLPKDIQESQMPNMAQADLPCATQRNAIHALQPVSVALLGFSRPSLEAERLNVCPWQPTNLLEGGKLASCPAWPSKNRFLGLDMYQQTSLQHLLTMCDPSVPYLDPSHKGPVQTSQRECAANTLPQTAIKNSCNIVPAASGTPLVASTIKSPLCGTPLLSSRNNSRKLAIKCQLLDENLSVEYTHPQEQACREIPTTPKGVSTPPNEAFPVSPLSVFQSSHSGRSSATMLQVYIPGFLRRAHPLKRYIFMTTPSEMAQGKLYSSRDAPQQVK